MYSYCMVTQLSYVAIYHNYYEHTHYDYVGMQAMHNLNTFRQMAPQLTPSNWMHLFNCTSWYPSRVMLSLPI